MEGGNDAYWLLTEERCKGDIWIVSEMQAGERLVWWGAHGSMHADPCMGSGGRRLTQDSVAHRHLQEDKRALVGVELGQLRQPLVPQQLCALNVVMRATLQEPAGRTQEDCWDPPCNSGPKEIRGLLLHLLDASLVGSAIAPRLPVTNGLPNETSHGSSVTVIKQAMSF